MRVLCLGHGYLATALHEEAKRRRWSVIENEKPCAEMCYEEIHELVTRVGLDLVINAAAYIPPSGRVTDCDSHKDETISGNVLFPHKLAIACGFGYSRLRLMHLSTACLYDEQREYTEADKPTRGWDGYCGTYVGCKLLAEKLVLEFPRSYVLRLRLPFDEVSHPRNYLNKIASFPTVLKHVNSLTHRGDFARAALDLAVAQAPPGIYHLCNPGQIDAETLVKMMVLRDIIGNEPGYAMNETTGARLSCTKLQVVGVTMRPVEEAVADALKNWKT